MRAWRRSTWEKYLTNDTTPFTQAIYIIEDGWCVNECRDSLVMKQISERLQGRCIERVVNKMSLRLKKLVWGLFAWRRKCSWTNKTENGMRISASIMKIAAVNGTKHRMSMETIKLVAVWDTPSARDVSVWHGSCVLDNEFYMINQLIAWFMLRNV